MFPHPSSFGGRESTRGEDGENGEEWKVSTQKTAREHGLQKNVNLFGKFWKCLYQRHPIRPPECSSHFKGITLFQSTFFFNEMFFSNDITSFFRTRPQLDPA